MNKKPTPIPLRLYNVMTAMLVFISGSIFIFGCNQEQDLSINNIKIKKAYLKRNEAYKEEVLSKCKQEMIEKATSYVDSLISAEIEYQLSDSIVFPEKPVKPQSLGKIIVSDTIVARPIFK